MRKLRLAVIAAAVMTTALVSAGTASASSRFVAPEFGHCVKYPRGESGSGYADAACTGVVVSGARYHWLAGPGSKPGFTASTGSVALTQWSGRITGKKAKPVLTCSASRTTGEFTGANSESLELTLTGCTTGSAACQSTGASAGEVQFAPLEGLLVTDKDEYWGLALVRWSPALGSALASFECAGTSVLIEGAILHVIKRDKTLSSEAELLRVGKEGAQEPSCYEPMACGETGAWQIPFSSIGGGPMLFSGLSAAGTQSDEEAIEADTRQEI
ncbi:MAG TPA: hypothetical protein VK778_15420 [Solirubrobacteraceae bacterium]|jgi:hypothetical protein|nr:hypothetical protein [Solirubrobacteraceae bacterium]